MKTVLNFLLDRCFKINSFYNDYFKALGTLGFIFKILIFSLMILMTIQFKKDVSFYFIVPTMLAYVLLFMWLATNLGGMSHYIAKPLLECMIYTILFQILMIIFNYFSDFSAWFSIIILWILIPVFFLILFGIHMGGP